MPITLDSNVTSLNGGTSINVTAPAGLNASRLDLIIAGANADNTSTAMTVAPDGTAYTTVAQAIASGGAGDWANIIAARKTGAATPGTVNVTWGGLYPSKWAIASRLAFSGVDLASPIDATSASVATGLVNNTVNPVFTIPGITTVTPGALVVAYIVAAQNTPEFTVPSGWTRVLQDSPFPNNNSVSLVVFTRLMPSAGATGDLVTTKTQLAGTLYGWGGSMIALKPDLTAPPAVMRSRANFFGL